MMNKNSLEAQVFSRRVIIVGFLQGLLLTILGARLAYLQIFQGRRYKMLSDNNRINIRLIKPSRGHILDRFGVPLAVNEQNFRIILIPEQTKSIQQSLINLREFIEIDDYTIQRVIKQAGKLAKFETIEVRDNLTWEEVAKVEVNLPDLPGLSIDIGENRSYPYGEATAHMIGYVGAPSKEEVAENRALALPGLKVGKTALEKTMEENLRGEAGAAEMEVNAVGREIRELRKTPGKKGKQVVLTIDGEFQRFVQNRLAKEFSATAVVMNVHTGEVYALASQPSFDPNDFSRGLTPEIWEGLLANPGKPLNNKAVSGQFPPASTFKMITAIAALKSKNVKRNFTAYCPGHYDFGKERFHCWEKRGHGHVDIEQAIMKSCDVFFYKVATEIGIKEIAKVAKDLGLGHKLGFEISEEVPGLVPSKGWKLGYMGELWQPGETIVTSIGQGYLKVTPLQLATMTSRLVNGGKAVVPHIIHSAGGEVTNVPEFPDIPIEKSHLELVKRAMDRVVNDEHGTARGSRIREPGMSMGGKTGTAQVKRITKEERLAGIKNEDLQRKFRDHGLFVGFAPVDRPQYACAVVVEHGCSGSASAAPIARDILTEIQRRKLFSTPVQA